MKKLAVLFLLTSAASSGLAHDIHFCEKHYISDYGIIYEFTQVEFHQKSQRIRSRDRRIISEKTTCIYSDVEHPAIHHNEEHLNLAPLENQSGQLQGSWVEKEISGKENGEKDYYARCPEKHTPGFDPLKCPLQDGPIS